MSCPVDHSSSSSSSQKQNEKCPVDHSTLKDQTDDKCPVEHKTRSTWSSIFSHSSDILDSSPSASSSASTSSPSPPASPTLPQDREISSIPRTDGSKWVYPSEAQFFNALLRKAHNPRESDMRVVVPIHNAVNERAWGDILSWENGWGGEKCGGVRLVSFKGRPGDLSLRARWRTLLGYQAPFDRHDWVVDRCGTRMRYIIDFYTGKPAPGTTNLAFFIDARPAFDNWDAVKMRTTRFCERWFGLNVGGLAPGSASSMASKGETRSAQVGETAKSSS